MAWFHDLVCEGEAPGRLACGGRLLAELRRPRFIDRSASFSSHGPTGQALWPFSQWSFVALLSKATATRIAALRGVSFSAGCF